MQVVPGQGTMDRVHSHGHSERPQARGGTVGAWDRITISAASPSTKCRRLQLEPSEWLYNNS